ncbi:MAG TPA: hypothetical protein VHF58_05525 [Solirubrobacterales bacterium]|nr:hypothetical protein [Solirubrobacterales bacterium]
MRVLAPRLALGAVLMLLCAPGSAAAGVLPEPTVPAAEVTTTGNNSELLNAIPISKKPGTRERVAMSIGPQRLDPIDVGDRLRVSAEVQFSTTCVSPGTRCVGSRYDFNPRLSARIVLAAGPDVGDPSFALSTTVKRMCKQTRPNRNHHCTLVVPNTDVPITPQTQLPCPAEGCYVNLVVGATHKKAKPSNRVVLGADRPDGTVAQDKGRLNVVQAGPDVPPPLGGSSADLVNSSVPLMESNKRRVVYSVPIPAAKKGEVLAFDATYVADLTGLRFNTFIGTRVIVAETPTSTKPSGLARESLNRGNATEANGFNCTLGRSGYKNPCTVAKAGATRITADAVDPAGAPATLYLNVVVSAKPLLDERVKGSPMLTLRPAEGLRVLRYAQ